MKLGLGTAQFGLLYGISNTHGKTNPNEIPQILERAASAGCEVIDTAPAYGDAEMILGNYLQANHPFKIVTKSNAINGRTVDNDLIHKFRNEFFDSLKRLHQSSVYALLAHNADDLLGPNSVGLFETMCNFRQDGLVEKIGASVYNKDQIDALLARYEIDILQIPLSIFDQRLMKDGTLEHLHKIGVEVHVRSVFLQGLLILPLEKIPAYFDPILPKLHTWHNNLAEHHLSAVEGALAFVTNIAHVGSTIVGFETLKQFEQILNARPDPLKFNTDILACDNPAFVNPGLWKIK